MSRKPVPEYILEMAKSDSLVFACVENYLHRDDVSYDDFIKILIEALAKEKNRLFGLVLDIKRYEVPVVHVHDKSILNPGGE